MSHARRPLRDLVYEARAWAVPLWAVLVAWSLAMPTSTEVRVACALLSMPAAWLAVIDLYTHRLPTPLVAAAMAGYAPLIVSASHHAAWTDLARAGCVGIVVAVVFFAKFWLTHGGTGLGDVRLAGVLGVYAGWFSWQAAGTMIVLAYVLVLPIAIARILRGRRDPIAFGPALLAGCYLSITIAAIAG